MNSIAYQRYAPYVEAYPNENLTTVMPEQYRYTLPVKAGEQRLLGELTGAACATLVAEIAERHAGPVVLIAPDMQNALRLHDEISQFTDQMVMIWRTGKPSLTTVFRLIRTLSPRVFPPFTSYHRCSVAY